MAKFIINIQGLKKLRHNVTAFGVLFFTNYLYYNNVNLSGFGELVFSWKNIDFKYKLIYICMKLNNRTIIDAKY